MISALCKGQLLAPFTVESSCNRSVFEIWLETCLIPLLQPGQVVVMDNATFYKGGRIEQLIQQAGCELLYLPAYSPDLNKSAFALAYLSLESCCLPLMFNSTSAIDPFY